MSKGLTLSPLVYGVTLGYAIGAAVGVPVMLLLGRWPLTILFTGLALVTGFVLWRAPNPTKLAVRQCAGAHTASGTAPESNDAGVALGSAADEPLVGMPGTGGVLLTSPVPQNESATVSS